MIFHLLYIIVIHAVFELFMTAVTYFCWMIYTGHFVPFHKVNIKQTSGLGVYLPSV